MSKLFTKYIAVEGEVKPGDKVLSESFGHPAVSVTVIFEDDSLLTDENNPNDPFGNDYYVLPKGTKKVKLFLCSRDIQVGDKGYAYWDDGSNREVDSFTQLQLDNIATLPISQKPDIFKVIGEVSPNAIWVKEGMEFEITDLPCLDQQIIKREGYCSNIRLKCPTCGTFH